MAPLSASSRSPSLLLALGDSVPAGSACACRPYPVLTARDVSAATHRRTRVSNEAVGGYTTEDVLQQLEPGSAVADSVRNANAVMIEVGANDVAHSDACGNDVACYQPEVTAMGDNLGAIVARVRELNPTPELPIVLLDYWSVWLGGDYAQQQGDAYVSAAKSLTGMVNDRIGSVATSTKSGSVDLRRAFRGPSDRWDETNLLARDGEHPNARGHHRIAGAVRRTIRVGRA